LPLRLLRRVGLLQKAPFPLLFCRPPDRLMLEPRRPPQAMEGSLRRARGLSLRFTVVDTTRMRPLHSHLLLPQRRRRFA
jgi:hypothetical protein